MSLWELVKGSDYLYCNQHHKHKTMKEVEQCNDLTKQKSTNQSNLDIAKVKLEGMDKCIKMEETRTDRLERIGGIFDNLCKANLDLTQPDHLALVSTLLTDDNVKSNMKSIEPANQ